MALASGTRLGPYEIISPLGAGGMGEVYRARDTNLSRDVAIKVMPEAFALDADRLARFSREAQVLASLNHPNIAAIYGIESNALVMELVEGEDLSVLIARHGHSAPAARPERGAERAEAERMGVGPHSQLNIEDALAIAKQIVDALEAAHESGIVHRDLKPANVKVRGDGTVKVLDFGLAKAIDPAGTSNANPSASPTMTARATQMGMVIGTAAYMAPEQARGRAVDHRADIWAFGVVLYEMLSGTRAFAGDDISITLAGVLKDDVRWDALPRDVPASLIRLMRRCLEKDPRRRLGWIGEARLTLENPAASDITAVSPTASPGRERLWMGVTAAAVTAAIAIAAWLYPRPVPPPEPISFFVDAPDGTPFASGPGLVTISPDGQQIAFVTGDQSDRKLWLRPLKSLTASPLGNTGGAFHPAWSPDGKSIAFTTTGGLSSLKRVDIVGGPALTLAEVAVERPAWSPLGVILYSGARSDGRIFSVPERGGTSTPVTELDKERAETQHAWPLFLPDGRRFVYLARSSDSAKSALYLASLDSPGRTHLVDVLSMPAYVPGFLLYQREGTIIAHPFDAEAGRLTGDPIPVLEDINFNSTNGRGAFGVSSTGVLVYRAGSAFSRSSVLTWFDQTGKEVGKVGEPANFLRGSISPDGHRFVVSQFDTAVESTTDLFMVDLDRGVSTRFTRGATDERYPVWTPNNQTVIFASNPKGVWDLYAKAAGGGPAERVLFESTEPKVPSDISSDGKTLLFNMGNAANSRLWTLPMTGDPKPVQVFPGSSDSETGGQFSPDGQWIAYVISTGPQAGNVFVQRYPANGIKTQISPVSGFNPRWTADSKRIVYQTANNMFESVAVSPAAEQMRAELPKPLFTLRQTNENRSSQFSMNGTAERFLLVVNPNRDAQAAPIPLTVIVNWAQTLIKR